MQVQVSTDHNIKNDERLIEYVEGVLTEVLERFTAHITRVEVHLSDTNSSEKFGTDDKRCVLEARIAGRKPVAVRHGAAKIELAVDGAAEKLKRTLDSTFGRLDKRHEEPPPAAE